MTEQIRQGDPDLLRSVLKIMVEMSAEADGACGAGYGMRRDERINRRNGYRSREEDTRVGTVELAVPKLRSGSYLPSGRWSAGVGPSKP